MEAAVFSSRLRRVATYFDAMLAIALAASYPLYVQFDALPRADEVGPPVPDRFPWAVAFVVLAYLGYRCRTVAAGVVVSTLASVSAGLAHTDAAAVTGVARSPILLSLAAIVVVFTAHLLGRCVELVVPPRVAAKLASEGVPSSLAVERQFVLGRERVDLRERSN